MVHCVYCFSSHFVHVYFVCEFMTKQNELLGVPVWRSQSIREVTILPCGANISSMSLCVMLRGSPLTYRLAPLILSLLGRASDTYAPTTNRTLAILVRPPNEREKEFIYHNKAKNITTNQYYTN